MTCSWKGLPFPTPEGQVGGHEGVGNIVKLGAGSEVQGVKIGDRVGIKWMAGICGNCRMWNAISHFSVPCTCYESWADIRIEQQHLASKVMMAYAPMAKLVDIIHQARSNNTWSRQQTM
jgi:hypothetical protein